jgi:hypothetical protein
MASNDIRRFHFYDQYIWQAIDFENYQRWVDQFFKAISEGTNGAAVLSGLDVTPNGGMNVQIAPGIAVSPTGQVMVVPTAQVATFASDPSNPVKHLLVSRPVLTDETLIPQPTNPLVNVPLHIQQSFQLVVISGTPAANPSYPTGLLQSEDTIVASISLVAGQTVISQTDIDRALVNVPRKRKKAFRTVGATGYTVGVTDGIVEIAATGGAAQITLPPAVTCVAEEFIFTKIDNSANPVNVLPNGAELISGQASQVIDDQWGTLRVYSTGTSWRVF